jgi:ABC-type arginine/histidine transport system permease subunit
MDYSLKRESRVALRGIILAVMLVADALVVGMSVVAQFQSAQIANQNLFSVAYSPYNLLFMTLIVLANMVVVYTIFFGKRRFK